jgi:hypothetical protein
MNADRPRAETSTDASVARPRSGLNEHCLCHWVAAIMPLTDAQCCIARAHDPIPAANASGIAPAGNRCNASSIPRACICSPPGNRDCRRVVDASISSRPHGIGSKSNSDSKRSSIDPTRGGKHSPAQVSYDTCRAATQADSAQS